MAYICITGNEKSPRVLEERIERVFREFPNVLCEIRVDYLDLNPTSAFAFLAGLPPEHTSRIILTNRLKVSGALAMGQCTWDVYTWQSWWQNVMALKPWFAVDIDWILLDRLGSESFTWRSKFRSKRTFFSLHQTIDEVELALPNLIAEAQEHGAGVKIASPVAQMHDLMRLARITRPVRELPLGICVAMGVTGRVWRWSKLAGKVTYFAAKKGLATAPGQDALDEIREYLQRKRRPDLYVLLGNDPENTFGEMKWNRLFSSRQANARYLNLPCADTPSPIWAQSALKFLSLADVRGASVTRPFKQCFGEPINTLTLKGEDWFTANTDGEAVVEILKNLNFQGTVVIAGSGGAAQGVAQELRLQGMPVNVWKRENEILPEMPAGEVLISTWPAEFQGDLLRQIPEDRFFYALVDAQLYFAEEKSPLALWAAERNIRYINGSEWWKKQAIRQDIIWFGENRLASVQREVIALVPHSKSALIRALALCMATKISIRLDHFVDCEDTQDFLRALKQIGLRQLDSKENGVLFESPEKIIPPQTKVLLGEGATGFRIFSFLTTLMEPGLVKIDVQESLRKRNHDPLWDWFGIDPSVVSWPIEIPSGLDLPREVNVSQSSQFASAALIAGAGAMARRGSTSLSLSLQGELVSEPYLDLTLHFLKEFGFDHHGVGKNLELQRHSKSREILDLSIEKDATALSYFELFARFFHFESFYKITSTTTQGDRFFPNLLDALLGGQSRISLKNHPDLAPTLWAAAVLFRKKLEVIDCSHLNGKESNRADALVQATCALGAIGEITATGFAVDFRNWKSDIQDEVFLSTHRDHRMAMSFLVLKAFFPKIEIDEIDSVKKSFPHFKEALQLLANAVFV